MINGKKIWVGQVFVEVRSRPQERKVRGEEVLELANEVV